MKKNKTSTASSKKTVKPAKKKVSAPAKKQPVKKAKPASSAKKKVAPAKKKLVAVAKKKVVVAKKPVKNVAANKVVAKPAKKVAAPVSKKAVVPEKQKAAPVAKKPVPSAKAKAVVKKEVPEVKPDSIIPGWTKVQFEYYTRSSVGVLYDAVSTASGLSAWFADYVDSQDNQFVFKWGTSEDQAVLIDAAPEEYVRFHWLSQPQGTYFEFRIKIDGITNEAALVISDYVEKGEEKEAQLLWDSQIHELMHILGS